MTENLKQFLAADTAGRATMLGDSGVAAEVRAYLGEPAFQELARLTSRADVKGHLAVKSPPNLVFCPGIMGSLLMSETKGGVWWLDARTRNHLDDLCLSGNGSDDRDSNNQVRAFTVDTTYEPFASAILARDDFGHRNFAYDWRKPYSANTAALRDLILKSYEDNHHEPVHLTGHSMGGVMIRSTLIEHGDELWNKIGRIVFIGTPHYGSTSIAGYLKNHLWGWDLMAILGLYLSRATFRSMWGALYLLPSPLGVYPGTRPGDSPRWRAQAGDGLGYEHPCANFDLFDAAAYRLDLTPAEQADLQRVLDGAAKFHRDLHDWHVQLNQEYKDRMLMIAGVGMKTLFRLAYRSGLGSLWKEMDKTMDRVPGDPHREGDGRVPLASARLSGVTMRYVQGSHGGLTNIPAVYEDVFRWLREEPLASTSETVEEALSAHLGGPAVASEAPHLDGTAESRGDDPGYLDLSDYHEAALRALDERVDRGEVPEFNRVRLL
jgi:pimeloyl-ACP methyl ester carboxylesterase